MLTLDCGSSAFPASCQANLRQVHEGTSSSTYAGNRAKQHAKTVTLQLQGYPLLEPRALQFEDLTVQRHYHRQLAISLKPGASRVLNTLSKAFCSASEANKFFLRSMELSK